MTVVSWLRQVYALGIRLSVKDGNLILSRPIPEHFAYLRQALEPLEGAIVEWLQTDRSQVLEDKTLRQCGYAADDFLQRFAVPHWAIELFGGGTLREGRVATSACVGLLFNFPLSVGLLRQAVTESLQYLPWLALQWWRDLAADPWRYWGAGLPHRPYIDFEYIDLSAEEATLGQDLKSLSDQYGRLELVLDESPTMHRLIKLGHNRYCYLFCYWPGYCAPSLVFNYINMLMLHLRKIPNNKGASVEGSSVSWPDLQSIETLSSNWVEQLWQQVAEHDDWHLKASDVLGGRAGFTVQALSTDFIMPTEQQSLMISRAEKKKLETICQKALPQGESLQEAELWGQLMLGLFVRVIGEHYPNESMINVFCHGVDAVSTVSKPTVQSQRDPLSDAFFSLISAQQQHVVSFSSTDVASVKLDKLFAWVRRYLPRSMDGESGVSEVSAGSPRFSFHVIDLHGSSESGKDLSDQLGKHQVSRQIFERLCVRSHSCSLGFSVVDEIQMWLIVGEHSVRFELFYNPGRHAGSFWLQRINEFQQQLLLPEKQAKTPVKKPVKKQSKPDDKAQLAFQNDKDDQNENNSDAIESDSQPRFFLDVLFNQVIQGPEATALVCGDQSLSYRALWVAATLGAEQLTAAGVGSGQRILIDGHLTPELIVAALATLLSGATYVVIKPGLSETLLKTMLGDGPNSGAHITQGILTQGIHAQSIHAHGIPNQSTPPASGFQAIYGKSPFNAQEWLAAVHDQDSFEVNKPQLARVHESPACATMNVVQNEKLTGPEINYGLFSSHIISWLQAHALSGAGQALRVPLTSPTFADSFHRQWACVLAAGGTLFVDQSMNEATEEHNRGDRPSRPFTYLEASVAHWQRMLASTQVVSDELGASDDLVFPDLKIAIVTSGLWDMSGLNALAQQLNPADRTEACQVFAALTTPEFVAPVAFQRFQQASSRPRPKMGWCIGTLGDTPSKTNLMVFDGLKRSVPRGVLGELWVQETQVGKKRLFKLDLQAKVDYRGQVWVQPGPLSRQYVAGWWVYLPALADAFKQQLTLADVFLSEDLSADRKAAPQLVFWVDQPGRERSWQELRQTLKHVWPTELLPINAIQLTYLPTYLTASLPTLSTTQSDVRSLQAGLHPDTFQAWLKATPNRQAASHDFWSNRLSSATAFPAGGGADVDHKPVSNMTIKVPAKVASIVGKINQSYQVSEIVIWAAALQAAVQWLWPKQVWPMACVAEERLTIGCTTLSLAQTPIQWFSELGKHWQQTEAFLPACLSWLNVSALTEYPKWTGREEVYAFAEPMIPIALGYDGLLDQDERFARRFGLYLATPKPANLTHESLDMTVRYHSAFFQAPQITLLLDTVQDWLDYAVAYPHQPVKYFYQSLERISDVSLDQHSNDCSINLQPRNGKTYPLTPLQENWWAWSQVSKLQPWHAGWFDFDGGFNLQAWQVALDEQIKHFVALRLKLLLQSDEGMRHGNLREDDPRQIVLSESDALLNCEDWRSRLKTSTSVALEKSLEQGIADMMHEPLELEKSALLRFYAIQWGAHSWRLLVLAHPLALDEIGVQSFLREWVGAYSILTSGKFATEKNVSEINSADGNGTDISIEDHYAGFLKWSEMHSRMRHLISHEQSLLTPLKFNGLMAREASQEKASTDIKGLALEKTQDLVAEDWVVPEEMLVDLRAHADRSGVSLDWVIQAFFVIQLMSYLALDESLSLYVSRDYRSARYRQSVGTFSSYGIFQVPVALMTDRQVTLADIWVLMRRWAAVSTPEFAPIPESDKGLYGYFDFHDALSPLPFNETQITPELSDLLGRPNSLMLSGRIRKGQLRLRLQYPADQFNSINFLPRMSHLLGQWLSGIERLADLDLLLPEEKAANVYLLGQGNRRIANWPPIYRLVEEQVQRTPTNIAVHQGDAVLTYWQMNQLANQVASRLAKLGCHVGETVLLCTADKFLLPAAMLGIWKAGANFMPVDLNLTDTLSRELVSDFSVRFVLASSKFNNRYERLPVDLTSIALDQFDQDKETHFIPPDLPALSGVYVVHKTVQHRYSRKVMISAESLANLVQWYCGELSWKPEDRVFLLANMDFHMAQKNIWAALVSGARIVFGESSVYDPEQVVKDIEAHQVTRLSTTPSAFYPLLKTKRLETRGGQVFSSLNTVVLGKELVRYSDIQLFFDLHPGCRVMSTYNIRVCTDVVAYHWIEPQDSSEYVPIGKPINRVQLFVMDRLGRLQPSGLVGQVAVLGPGVGRLIGEVDPEQQQSFVRVPDSGYLFYSGDLACYDANGTLTFVGRQNGERPIRDVEISIKQLEERLMTFPGVVSARIVLNENDQKNDQKMVAYLQLLAPEHFRSDGFRNRLSWLYPNARLPDDYQLIESVDALMAPFMMDTDMTGADSTNSDSTNSDSTNTSQSSGETFQARQHQAV